MPGEKCAWREFERLVESYPPGLLFPRSVTAPVRGLGFVTELQKYLAHQKQPPPRTLQQDYA